jgi:hypothetical protein
MNQKQNTQEQICSYILEQLEKKTNQTLSKGETDAFRIFWETQNYQITAQQLDLPPKKAINLLHKAFEKLQVRKITPRFKTDADFLSAPIFIHPFSTRLYHVLRFMDCNNLNELLSYTKKELLGKRGFGKKAWEEIERYLKYSSIYIDTRKSKIPEALKINFIGIGKSILSDYMTVNNWWEKDFSRQELLDAFGLGALERGLLNAPDINDLPDKIFKEFPEFLKYKK